MFISLNKKILFTIFAFFLITTLTFIIMFDGIIGKNIKEEHSSLLTRNQYVIELLNENISLRKQIRVLQPGNTASLIDKLKQKQEELQRERQLNDELNQNYNEKYSTIAETLKIIGFGAFLLIISLVLLWIILRKWVISPLDRLTMLSVGVANGDFSQRMKIKKSRISDEFDTLMSTLNFMLDSIENNVSQIKQKEVFLQNLIDSLPDAVRLIDEEYNIILANRAYHEYVKNNCLFPALKCFQSYDKEAQKPCPTGKYACPLHELLKMDKKDIKLIHSVNNKPLSISASRLKIDGRKAIVESFRDLSENIHFSHQQKISSLGFLATSLAHEMKNNLGAINLILSGLLEKYYKDVSDNDEQKKYLQMVSNQITECVQVPERLLKLSRSNNSEESKFNVAGSIKDILSLLDYEIKSKGIVLETKFSGKRIILEGNETDFKMIILNLVQNAINAMPNGGHLIVRAINNKQNLTIQVKDSGCGISKQDIAHIFEPFYSSSKTKKSGTGLGLAIVKDLVSKYHAAISVSSEENVGSCFEIVFNH